MLKQLSFYGVLVAVAVLCAACGTGSAPVVSAGASQSEYATVPASATPLPSVGNPVGTVVVLKPTSGTGSATLTSLAKGGSLVFTIDCASGKVQISRAPDISDTLTCVGLPVSLTLSGALLNSSPLRIVTASTNAWNIAAGAQS